MMTLDLALSILRRREIGAVAAASARADVSGRPLATATVETKATAP